MKAQYTPGPWFAQGDHVMHYPSEHKNNRDDRMHTIATVHTSYKPEIGHSDARLIAAAPEMLEALIGLSFHVPDNQSALLDAALKKAYKAIAKAEGRSHE